MKRFAQVIAVLAVLLVVLAAGGAFWLRTKANDFLTPPDNPPGQASIATYAQPAAAETLAPVNTPSTATLPAFAWDSIASPPKAARAWTRWWWPGGDVDAATVDAQLALLDEAGFGGVEIQPFLSGMLAVKDPKVMERVYSFDSEAYYKVLRSGIESAVARGMQFDLSHFSGWPPGGPEVTLDDSLTIMAYAETDISGDAGKSLRVELPRPTPGVGEYLFGMTEFSGVDFTNFPAAHAQLLSVVGARRVAGKHAWNPFDLNDTETLDPQSLQVLTEHVKDGVLQWNAPDGDWTVIASYLLPSGEVPMGAAQKPQGFVLDHLRKEQVLGHYEYAYGARTGLPEYYGKGLRGFFNDSLEFRLRRMAVADILQEFKARRGYDLAPYLPAMYVEATDNFYVREILGIHAAPEFQVTPLDERIRHDYQQTLSDLMIERFVETSAVWAQERGLASRGQSYGMDLDIIRALGANTIPETEQLWAGGADVTLKFASSAAALYGRNLVSAESFVWINRDYMPTARRIKAAADKLLLAGINHIVYHGTPYPFKGGDPSPFGAEEWAPFTGPDNPAHFSSNISPGDTALWPDIPALNSYIARSQNLLRQGAPAADVLVYFPFLGFHGFEEGAPSSETLINGALPDADPMGVGNENALLKEGRQQLQRLVSVPPYETDPRVAWMSKLQPLLAELDRRGISWSWVNDHALQTGKVASGRLAASGGTYGAVVLPNIEALEPRTLSALQQLASEGTPVYLSGSQPTRQPGFKDAATGDAAVQHGVADLLAHGAKALEFTPQAWLAALQNSPDETVRYQSGSAIKRYRRILPGQGEIQLLGNQSAGTESLQLQVPIDTSLWWFDALEGVAWPVKAVDGRVDFTLAGFESRFLMVGVPLPAGVPTREPAGIAVQRATHRWPLPKWNIVLEDYAAKDDALFDWRAVAALQYARGPGKYSHEFVLQGMSPDARYLLKLGLVQGSARVKVNGVDVGRASVPPFVIDITSALKAGSNAIDMDVLAPLRNDFVGRALAGDPHYKQMEIYRNELVAAGLMGPVEIVEVR